MPLNRGTWVKAIGAVGVSSADARRADAAAYYNTTPGTVRTGLLYPNTSTYQLVTANAGWTYNLQPVPGFIIGRAAGEGAYTLNSTGTTSVSTGVAPASGLSRWDLIYIKQNDTEKGDADNQPVFGVVQGTAAASPTKPTASVPTGAVVIAEAQIFSGTTGTNSASNTLTQTWVYTALTGQPVPVRNTTERPASPRTGDKVLRLDVTVSLDPIETWNGTSWRFPFAYAEYQNGGFAIASGNAMWDVGPLTVHPTYNWNNDFANVSGAISGSVNITKNGLYTVSCLSAPGGGPGASHMLLRTATAPLAVGYTAGVVWEYQASFTRYLLAGSYVHARVYQTNSTTNSTNLSILKHDGVW